MFFTFNIQIFFPPTGSQSKCRSFSRLVLERRSRRMVVGNSYHDNSGVRNRKLNNIPSCHLTWPIKLISSFLTTTKVTGIRSISNYIKLATTESQIVTRGFAVHKLIIIHDINMFCFISRLKFHLWVPIHRWRFDSQCMVASLLWWRIDRQPSDVITVKLCNVTCR